MTASAIEQVGIKWDYCAIVASKAKQSPAAGDRFATLAMTVFPLDPSPL
jgi:hypothetical protein